MTLRERLLYLPEYIQHFWRLAVSRSPLCKLCSSRPVPVMSKTPRSASSVYDIFACCARGMAKAGILPTNLSVFRAGPEDDDIIRDLERASRKAAF
ncbi:hypothetical protein KCP71_07415 [Salmonella enterica subsp. enterica]|nr:hypothetical protein KCP71_07415 [Salmonella enterica subsp. enterica]